MTEWTTVVKTGGMGSYGGTETELAMAVMVRMRDEESKLIRQVKTLIKKHQELAYRILTADVDGWTPVHACALRGSKKLLKCYLSAGIDINFRMGQPEGLPKNCTLMHMAALRGDIKLLEYLLSKGASVNCRDSMGGTPVIYASKRKDKQVVNLLAQHGANMEGVEIPTNNNGLECITPQPTHTKFCFF